MYTERQIERLLGLYEGYGRDGDRHITFLDIQSWAEDPGGDSTWQWLIRYDADAWTANRGPLPPDSDLALTLYDFHTAMSRLPLFQRAVLALTVMGFRQDEIAKILKIKQQRVSNIVRGRLVRDEEGRVVYNGDGRPIRRGGAVQKLTKRMNGEE